MSDERCNHPECDSEQEGLRVGPSKTMYCPDHTDYAVGRAFGPLHAMLEGARRAGIGQEREDADE